MGSRLRRMTAALWLTALVTIAPTLTSGSTCNNLPWCLPKNYDKKKPPFLFDTSDDRQLMNIHYAFSIREVSKVMDSEQTLQIPMYFTVSWTEDRLVVDQAHMAWGKSLTGPVNESTEDAETLKLFWKPNLEIYGLQEFKKHNILSEMAGLRVSRSKKITFDIKVTIVVSCQMSFNDYPFDSHTCFFQVGSYFYDKNSMTCTADVNDPSAANSNIRERNLQHSVSFRKLRRSRRVVRLQSGQSKHSMQETIMRSFATFGRVTHQYSSSLAVGRVYLDVQNLLTRLWQDPLRGVCSLWVRSDSEEEARTTHLPGLHSMLPVCDGFLD